MGAKESELSQGFDRELEAVRPFGSFNQAGAAVLHLLQQLVGLDLWMVTRREGEDWIILTAEDRSYGIRSGDVLRWSDSFCSRMVEGLGPRIAPIADRVEAYAEAPIGDQVPIGAYVGVPLRRPDGSLFGTLCGIDPSPQPASIRGQLRTIETFARLLATILEYENELERRLREIERAEAEAECDELTGLFNRRAWNRFVEAEDKRCRRYGGPAGVVLVDLNNLKEVNDQHGHAAGDELLQRASEVLTRTMRESDIVARIGGDEFAVLTPEESSKYLDDLERRLRIEFQAAGVEASIGTARRDPRYDLPRALEEADQAMYADKRGETDPGV